MKRKNLKIAIAVLSILLVSLVVTAIALQLDQGDKPGDTELQTTIPSGVSGAPGDSGADATTEEPSDQPTENVQQAGPSEDGPLYLNDELCIVHAGNFSGRYVEDGSDMEILEVFAVVVENRGNRTLQLAQFQIHDGVNTFDFRLTTLPPGERAVVQDLNKGALTDSGAHLSASVETLVHFQQEPSVHEDTFAVSGGEGYVEVRNLTDAEIPGPIYLYYKTRTADGYAGGITYRLTIPGLAAGQTYQTAAAHFWLGSSQVMFLDYAQ